MLYFFRINIGDSARPRGDGTCSDAEPRVHPLLGQAVKYTLFLTQRCNLACDYCYVGKTKDRMSLDAATRIVDFAFQNTPTSEDIDIGFFGGEPLLEFPLLEEVTLLIKAHTRYDPCRVKLSVVTNGTLLSAEIVRFLQRHRVALTISCDGPPAVHDKYRRFPDGGRTSALVENGIRTAIAVLGRVPVNAVYRPDTIERLPDVIDYLSSLGVRQIYLNPDFSASWTEKETARVPPIYQAIAERYMNFYRQGLPHFISLIDSKITVMLRGGYQPLERCRMGTGEFAFAPSGDIFPCERLVASEPGEHVIGSTNGLIRIGPLRDYFAAGPAINAPCILCGLREYCVNWCGCSNYFMTGHYNRVSPFLCVSERTLMELAVLVFRSLESELGPTFMDHVGGKGVAASARNPGGDGRIDRPGEVFRPEPGIGQAKL